MDFDELDPYEPFSSEVTCLLTALDDANPDRTVQLFTVCLRNLFDDFVDHHPNRPSSDHEKRVRRFLEHVDRLGSVPPTQEELDRAPVLDGWCAAVLGSTPFLLGQSTGHPRLRCGARTRTSPLIRIGPDRSWARTWNRFYVLDGYSPKTLFKMQADGVVAPDVTPIEVDPGPLH